MAQNYIRFSLVDLGDGIQAIKDNCENDQRVMLGGKAVGLGSLRLKTFAHRGPTCVYCGMKATHFAIEKTGQSNLDLYHMNLWGLRNGDEILFTHDHVHARSLGGADSLRNSVTACTTCNSRKAKYETKMNNHFKQNKKVTFDVLITEAIKIFGEDLVYKFFPKTT